MNPRQRHALIFPVAYADGTTPIAGYVQDHGRWRTILTVNK